MSCNGCRVLRKRCNDNCELRSCLQWIDGAEAQGHATTFVAKFFGRASLTNLLTAVPESQRAALFLSLLYEACGRVVNPVHGALGVLWSGDWQACQAAVEAVFKGEMPHPLTASPPAGSYDSSSIHIHPVELSKYPKEGLSTPILQHTASTGTLVHRTRIREAKSERDCALPFLWLRGSDCRRELSEIGMRTVKEKLEMPKPMNDDVWNLLKTMQSKRNAGQLHSSRKALKRKHGETSRRELVRPVPQRASSGIKALLKAIHGADQEMEVLPESDVVLDLTLSLHPVTTPPS